MKDLDSLKDIDLASVTSSIWEIELEVLKTSKSLSLLNIPSGITLLDLGNLLSRSLSEPFHLPISLNSYKGPFLSGMVFPPNIENIHLVETQKSMPSSSIAFPTRTKKITIENPLKFSNLDSIQLPDSVESFTVVGEYNCSFEKLKLPLGITHIDLGKSIQPTDLLNSSLLTDVKNTQVNRQVLSKSPLVVTSTNKNILNALHNYKPRVDRIQVVLDNIYSSIGDVWTNVLLEGRIQVRELILVNGTGNTCLSDCEDVFRRSKQLDRKLCKKLLVLCETFSYTSHLNMARSLRDLGDISIEVSYFKQKPTECIVPRLADILGIEKNDSQYSSNNFGVISTTISMGPDGNLKLVIGSSPMKYSAPVRASSSIPVSSSTLVDTSSTPMEPGPKTIILHTWSKCSFCDKQEGYIEEFKKTSEKHRNVFNDMVEIKKIENPEDIDDKRVDSFPTWVKNNELIVGTQNKKKLEEMLFID